MSGSSIAGTRSLATRFGTIRGVLFDIDDTLVDLEFAMTAALRDVSEHLLPGLDEAGWERFGRIFTRETTHFYDRYLAGEITFNEQRLLRGRAALGYFGVELADGEQPHHRVRSYASREQQRPRLSAREAGCGRPGTDYRSGWHRHRWRRKAGPRDLPRGCPADRY